MCHDTHVAHKTVKLTAFAIALIVVVLLPGALLSAAGLPYAGSAASLGGITGVCAVIVVGLRGTVPVALCAGVLVMLAMTAYHRPWWAFIVLATAAALLGLVDIKGLSAAYAFVPICAGFALAMPPVLAHNTVFGAVIGGLATTASALLAAGFSWILLRKLPRPKLVPLSRQRSYLYALNLAFLIGIAAFIVAKLHLDNAGAWLILTLAIVVQPYVQDGIPKTLSRVGGTVIGFFIAIGIATSVSQPALYYAFGVACVSVALGLKLTHQSYWTYAMFLTPGVVLLVGTSSSVTSTAQARLWATIAAGAAALAVMLITAPWYRRDAQRLNLPRY